MAKNRRVVDWLARLDQLTDDLDADPAAEPKAVAFVAGKSVGAHAASIVHGQAAHSSDGVVALPLDDSSGQAEWLMLTFASPRDIPPAEVLTSVARRSSAALRRNRARQDESREQRGVRLRLAVADRLVGLIDAHAIAKALNDAIVPELVDAVEVEVDLEPAPAEGESIRIEAASGPTVIVRRAGGWTAAEQAILQDIADVTRRALCEASMIDEQRRSRSILERSLLPAALLPVAGLQLASRYLPAGRGQQAGGDFYDALRGPTGTTLIVGDVQGKGIEAATVTSLARHTLRDGALEGAPPAELLRRLNRALLYGQAEQALGGTHSAMRFVTVAVALLTPAGDGFDVLVARAGHPPPLIVRPAGEIEFVEPRGVLLGVADDPSFEEARVHLGLADTLVLYTDGVTEQRRTQSVFDEVQLGRMVRHHLGVVNAESIADAIRDTVLLVSPEEVRDDIAVLVACVS